MPRLFFGLELPAIHTTQLGLIQNGVPGMRWIEPSDFHITLCFLGDISSNAANEVLDAVDRKRLHAPKIEFSELKTFGSKKPTSLHVRIIDNPALTALQASLTNLIRRLELEPDNRKFVPHVTLGRCRTVKPAALAVYISSQGMLSLPPYEARRLVLYSARESTGGGPYHVEAAWPLQPASDTNFIATREDGCHIA